MVLAESESEIWDDDLDEEDEEGDFEFSEYDLTASPNDFNVRTILDFLDSGVIRIPGFQRHYVWQQRQASRLIESGLGADDVLLHSYIVSSTASTTMEMLWEKTKDEMRKRHVLFQDEDADSYIRDMFEEVLRES